MNRSDRWQRTTETPLIAAALVFLVAYAVPIAWPAAPPGYGLPATRSWW